MQKEMRLKRRQLRVFDYDDNEVLINFPSSMQLEDYFEKVQAIIEGKDKTPESKYARAFLAEMNAPEKFVKEVQNEDLVKMLMVLCGLETVTGEKKS